MNGASEVDYEMGYGADEFGNVLRGPFSGEKTDFDCEEIGPHQWRLRHSGTPFDLTIRVVEQAPRKLGLFNLPVLAVKFTFNEADESLREKFFHRFHQYFHKGGG